MNMAHFEAMLGARICQPKRLNSAFGLLQPSV